MPDQFHADRWSQSLLDASEASKGVVGFDGPFTLPVEQRLLVEAAEHGHQRALLQCIEHFGLVGSDAKRFVRSLVGKAQNLTVAQVRAELDARLQGRRPAAAKGGPTKVLCLAARVAHTGPAGATPLDERYVFMEQFDPVNCVTDFVNNLAKSGSKQDAVDYARHILSGRQDGCTANSPTRITVRTDSWVVSYIALS